MCQALDSPGPECFENKLGRLYKHPQEAAAKSNRLEDSNEIAVMVAQSTDLICIHQILQMSG